MFSKLIISKNQRARKIKQSNIEALGHTFTRRKIDKQWYNFQNSLIIHYTNKVQ